MTEAVKEAAEHAIEQANANLERALQLLEEAVGAAEKMVVKTPAPK